MKNTKDFLFGWLSWTERPNLYQNLPEPCRIQPKAPRVALPAVLACVSLSGLERRAVVD
ncbi:MAG: hypothetical protein GY814_17480 [Gammaproteobacteria bacterium]|nr:hypothetical protein [Gammaproteobacteria bacterium]